MMTFQRQISDNGRLPVGCGEFSHLAGVNQLAFGPITGNDKIKIRYGHAGTIQPGFASDPLHAGHRGWLDHRHRPCVQTLT